MTELPKNFSPTDVCAGLGLKKATFRKLGDGPWAGTIETDGRCFEVEQLASKWTVTDETGHVVSGPSLDVAVRRAGLVSS